MLWNDTKRVAVCFNVMVEQWSDGKAPGIGRTGNPLGRAGVVDTEAVSWAEYGTKRGLPRVLRVLERAGIRSTIFFNAIIAERQPELVRGAAKRGHEVAGHGYAQDIFPVYLEEPEERAGIRRCTELLAAAAGSRPLGWISPRVTPSANTTRLLAEAGYCWHGDCADDDLPYVQRFGSRSIVALPFGMEVNDLPHYIRWGNAPREMLAIFEDTFAQMKREDDASILDVTVHAHLFARPFGIWVLERMIDAAQRDDDAWVATRGEVAAHALPTFAEPQVL